MEEGLKGNHLLSLDDRQRLVATGILDVDRFDEKAVVLITNRGVLTIEGTELHINRLSVEKGEVAIEGQVDRLGYAELKEKGSIFKGLFR